MARYIDAEELCRRLTECWETNDIDKGRVIQQVIDRVITPIVVGTPTADVVEVVRCGQCKDFEPHGNGKGGICRNRKCKGLRYATDFCSYGERKDA